MNGNTRYRTKLLNKDAQALVKGGGNFQAAVTELLRNHSAQTEDKRPSRGGTTSFRYKGV